MARQGGQRGGGPGHDDGCCLGHPLVALRSVAGGLRFQAARIQLAAGKTAQARTTLIPLAFNPHGGGQTKFAARLVQMIDEGEPAAKIAALQPEKGSEDDEADGDDTRRKGDTKSK